MTEKTNRSIITFITTLLVISLFVLGGFVVWISNPGNLAGAFLVAKEERPDLKHQKHTDWFGFSIAYPGNWELDPAGEKSLGIHSPGGNGLKFTIFDDPKVVALNDREINLYLDQLVETAIEQGGKLEKREENTISKWGSFPAFKRSYSRQVISPRNEMAKYAYQFKISMYLIKFDQKILGVQEITNQANGYICQPGFKFIREKFKSNIQQQEKKNGS